MDTSFLLENATSIGLILGVSFFFLAYFRNEKMREIVGKVLPFLPQLFSILGSFLTDKKGEWDAHDATVVMGRVATKIQATIADLENKSFADVEQEVYDIVSEELKAYEGQKGVPNLDDATVRAQVRIIFEQLKKALNS